MNNPNLDITIGIVGGGQLGKMMAQSAKSSGYRVIILDPQKDCPASQVSDQQLVAAYNDPVTLKELCQLSTVITYEFENVDAETLKQLTNTSNFPQGVQVLEITQNRILEKNFLRSNGLPVGNYEPVYETSHLMPALEKIGYPAVLKTCRFGYDGKGQVILKDSSHLPQAMELVENSECILEAWVPFSKELSIMVSRNASGQLSLFPVSENQHRDNILHLSIVPARISSNIEMRIQDLAKRIADKLDLVGTLGIELFLVEEETIFINELAPRPHNSGHYSIEACNFSQFDTSIQAVLGLSMPNIQLLKPVIMVNVLGQDQEKVFELKTHKPNWHFHDYGKKEGKYNRKMGHITILTDCIQTTLKEIDDTRIWRNN